jgi:hypothetical protein
MKRMLLILPLLLLAGWLGAPRASAQHVELGIFGDYTRLSQTKTNMLGVGARLGFNVVHPVLFEAQMAYDFDQAFTEGFTSSTGGTISTANSNVKVLKGLFGPKLQVGGPVKFFVTAKGGFIHFSFNPNPATGTGAISTIQNLRLNNVDAMFYPGAGLMASIGPVGLRVDVGDDMYFANGAHNNFVVQFGPVIHF